MEKIIKYLTELGFEEYKPTFDANSSLVHLRKPTDTGFVHIEIPFVTDGVPYVKICGFGDNMIEFLHRLNIAFAG
jgi:hypothetical protein